MEKVIKQSDWQARWISYPYEQFDTAKGMTAPHFRKTFIFGQAIKQAKVKICGLGYFELYVNGKRVGDEVLNPPFTRYDVSAIYCTYDITDMLVIGENVMGVILGNGMYNVFAKNVWDYEKAPWRHHPKLLLEADIITTETDLLVMSDLSWKTSFGPILSDSLYEGEIYDARLEMPSWNKVGFDDSMWKQVTLCRGAGGNLKPMEMEACRVIDRINPKAYWEASPGVWVYDMGINMTGWVKLKVSGQAGTTVTLSFAEKINEERFIDPSNINIFADPEKFQTDIYILKGDGLESWEPKFTYHGFQYVQIIGFPGTPDLYSIEGCIVHTDLKTGGSFECSNELLNKVQSAVRLSTLGNYHGIPTDCPQREKNGWTGDTILSAEQVLLNFQPAKAYRKWLNDIVDCQRPSGQLPGIVPTGGWGYNWGSGPAWDSVLIMIPWYMYVYLGDKSILSEMYHSMKRYVDYMTSMSVGYVVDFGLGDWCPPNGGPEAYKCPAKVTDTATYYMNCRVISDTAQILGCEEDARFYGELKENIYQSFNKEFVNTETGEVTGCCQTSYACALYFGLVEGMVKEKVVNNLVKEVEKYSRHIDCGILGTKYILNALTDAGRADLAYAIATQTTFPSWGYWIEQGATTLWETWNGDSSRNHHMFSDISDWFYKGLAGINPDSEEPGFRHIIIKPNPINGLEWVKASHKSPNGLIECNWHKTRKGNFNLKVSIPYNCHATIYIPCDYGKEIKENGNPLITSKNIKLIDWKDGYSVLHANEGEYTFVL